MVEKTNITLIGMPGSGKSTVGRLLAKKLGFRFVDVDALLDEVLGMPPGEFLKKFGDSEILKKEEEAILELEGKKTVYAPGGSCVYSEKAMIHLEEISTIIYLQVHLKDIIDRIGSPIGRGIVGSIKKTLEELYIERTPLYKRYADTTIEANEKQIEEIIEEIIERLRPA
ncbi:MAG: shikimate kinase [Candidatus Altiarchaeota archaeon]